LIPAGTVESRIGFDDGRILVPHTQSCVSRVSRWPKKIPGGLALSLATTETAA